MQRLKLLVCISLICVYCYGKTAACSNEGTEITGYENIPYGAGPPNSRLLQTYNLQELLKELDDATQQYNQLI